MEHDKTATAISRDPYELSIVHVNMSKIVSIFHSRVESCWQEILQIDSSYITAMSGLNFCAKLHGLQSAPSAERPDSP